MDTFRLSHKMQVGCYAEISTLTSYPNHSHDTYEIEVIKGTSFHNVIDGTDYCVNGLSCFFYMPLSRHYFYSDANGTGKIWKIGFKEDFLPKEYMDIILTRGRTIGKDVPKGFCDRLISACEEITSFYFEEENHENLVFPLYLKAMISKLVVMVYEIDCSEEAPVNPPLDDPMARVYAYIHSHFNQHLSLPVLAEIAGMSHGYFSRCFKTSAGMTYTDYITSVRMNYARSLLSSSSYSLKRISEQTGYYSESGFLKAFQKYFGFHPFQLHQNAAGGRKKDETKKQTAPQNPQLPIPIPKKYQKGSEIFCVAPHITAPPAYQKQAQVFCSYVYDMFGISFTVSGENVSDGIRLTENPKLSGEAYQIAADNGTVTVSASSVSGFSHGCSVLLQLAEVQNGVISLPSLQIRDHPDTEFRGMMIDLARGQYSLPEILAFADICYFYRLRVLHLHFADGPDPNGFKLPLPHFPKLWNANTYHTEDIEAIRTYVSDRGILLLPDIEMPAHAQPLTTHYPEKFGDHGALICIGCPGVFNELRQMILDVCELFPESPYLHIGCDEANYSQWDSCPRCTALRKQLKLPSSAALYTYTVGRCTDMVLKAGRIPIIWEGFPKEGAAEISKETIVMPFQSIYHNAADLTRAGFHVINTSWQPLYIVPSRPKFFRPEEIYRWNYTRWLYEDAVDDADPIDVEDPEMVLGAEICLWEGTCYADDGRILEQNAAALSERLWNTQYIADFAKFQSGKEAVSGRLTAMIENRLR